MKIFVINGPNLNMLGLREREHYGTGTYQELCDMIRAYADEKNIDVELCQSNHEGDLVDYIQRAYFERADGIVINPGAYTHTSIALLDAVKSVRLPTVEVHISKVEQREDFRQVSFIRQACAKTITGLGFEGYLRAIDFLTKEN
jgi:3-dehydroquinate dehydratase-2